MYFALVNADAFPANAIIDAMIGEDALVPPATIQPPWTYTATPVAGSATAEMSDAVRIVQCASCCQAGLATYPEQPEPLPRHAGSVQPRADVDFARLVPPTAMTPASDAGPVFPFWLTFLKQPFCVVHGGSP